MGTFFNPKNKLMLRDLRSEIYIDKSLLIAEANKLLGTSGNFLCVSRPRRFGKSMASNMLAAYYSKGCDSKDIFSRLKISQTDNWEENLNAFNVIQMDLNGFYHSLKNPENLIPEMTKAVVLEMKAEIPDAELDENDSLPAAILKAYNKTGETFVLLFDEYDVLVREKAKPSIFESYLDFLSSLFKNNNLKEAISLAYLTGILPIVRDRIQSKMNEFDEYSMTNARSLAPFSGFTEDEVRSLCDEHGLDFSECKRWYDGYKLGKETHIYSPKSVVTAAKDGEFDDYWSQTGSYEALKDYILMNFEGIKDDVVTMIGGGKIDVNIHSYLNTMTDFHSKDDVFTYLIHLGYLAYDRSIKQCYIPNVEVRSQWIFSIRTSPDYTKIMELVNDSKNLLQRTLEKDAEYVAQSLTKAHMRVTNPLTYNNEASFQSAIGLAYFYATSQYTIIKELPTGKGYADVAFIPFVPNIPAIIVELKNNKLAQGAIEQIKERKYDECLSHYRGNMLFVGINYDERSKKHDCLIERLHLS
mgnify:CR=1 FL=1